MKFRILFLLSFVSTIGSAQNIIVDSLNSNFTFARTSDVFDYVHDSFDTSNYEWVANMTCQFDTLYYKTLDSIYFAFLNKSKEIGGNAFKVANSDIFSFKRKYISISVFRIRAQKRKENYDLFLENKIYLFGDLHYLRKEWRPTVRVIIDGIKYNIDRFCFREFNLPNGMTMTMKFKEKTSWYNSKVKRTGKPNALNLYIHSNSVIDIDYGQFLTRILTKL